MNWQRSNLRVTTGSAVRYDGSARSYPRLLMRPKTAHYTGVRRPQQPDSALNGGGDTEMTDKQVRVVCRSFSVMAVTPRPRPKTASAQPPRSVTPGHRNYRKSSYVNNRRNSVDTNNKSKRHQRKSEAEPKQQTRTIQASVKVDDISFWDVVSDPEEIKSRLATFYKRIVECFNYKSDMLCHIPEVGQVCVEKPECDNIRIDLKCSCEKEVSALRDIYQNMKLLGIFNKVLIDDETLWDMQINRVHLSLSIDESQFTQAHPVSSLTEYQGALTSPRQDEDNLESDELEEECMKALKTHSQDLRRAITELNKRYAKLQEQMTDILFALQMAIPANNEPCRTISQIISCHSNLKRSPSVGRVVRTDLVRELLTIINLIRIKTDESRYHILVAVEYVLAADKNKLLSECEAKAAEISEMLRVNYDFSTLDGATRVSLSKFKSNLFPGLVYFVPTLLKKADDLCTCISNLIVYSN